jgi:hypothetical protein
MLTITIASLTLVSCATVGSGDGKYTGYDLSNSFAFSCNGFQGAALEACHRAGSPGTANQ